MMTKRIKLFLKGIAILFCIIIVMMAGVYFYLHTDHGQKYTQAKISETIPGSITWDNARVSLLTARVDVKKVFIKDPSGEEVVGFDRLLIEYSWPSLLRGKLTINVVLLEKPWTTLRAGKTGEINLVRTFVRATPEAPAKREETVKKAGYSLPINIIIEKFKLTNGSLQFETADRNTEIILQGIDVTARTDLSKQSGKCTLQIDQGTIKSSNIRKRIDQCTLEAMLSDGRIDPLNVRIQSAASILKLSGTATNIFSKPTVDAVIDLNTSLHEIKQSFLLKPTLTGQAKAHLRITGTLDNPGANLRIDYGGGTILENRINRMHVDLRMKDRLIAVNTLQVKAADGSIEGQGKIDLQKAFLNGFLSPEKNLGALTYELTFEQKGMNLEKLRSNGQKWKGIVNSHLSLSGTGFSPQDMTAHASLRIDGKKITTQQLVHPVDLQVNSNVEMYRGVATVKRLNIRADRSELNADGHVNTLTHAISAKLSLIAPDLAGTLSPFGLNTVRGNVGLEATVSGSTERPLFALNLQGDGLRFQDITLGSMNLKADLDKSGILKVSHCKVDNGASALRIMGTAQIYDQTTMKPSKNPAFTLNLEGDTIRLEDFAEKIKGIISITGNLEGNLASPRGTVILHGHDFDLYDQQLSEIKITSFMDGTKIRLDPFQIFLTRTESIQGTGWISLQREYNLSFISKGFSLHNIEKMRKHNIAGGMVLFDISGKGTFDNPRLSGNIFVSNVLIKGKETDDIHFKVDLHDQIARISGKLNFDLDGSFDLKKKDFSASAIFNETDLSPYWKIAGKPDLSGKLTGIIKASGNSQSVKTINGDINVTALDLFHKETKILSTDKLIVSLKNEELSIADCILMIPPDGRIVLSGTGKLDGSTTFRADGAVPLDIAGHFVENIQDITGSLIISSRVNGTIRHPNIYADIELKKVGCTIPVLLQKMHNLNGRIKLSPEEIVLGGISGHLDKGSFDIAGTMELRKGYRPEKVSVKVRTGSVPIQVPDTLDMLFNSQLQIEGTEEKSIVKGEIMLLEGMYYKDINLSLLKGIGQKKREDAPLREEITHPFLKNMGLDISIKQRNYFLVDNNLAKLDVNPDLRIVGTINNPILRGRASVESGAVTYQGKTFVVKKGTIDFINPYKIDPEFDIQSEVKVREWLIALGISGTRDHLNFKLTSYPPEEHGDILSLLLLGKTTGELIAKEGGSTKSTEQMLAGLIASTFGEDIKESTGLDVFEVETTGNNNEESSGRVKVTIGKELSRRLTVKDSVESREGEITHRAIAEYKLLENFLARGFQDSRGVYGGELQFRLEFR
jgi:translocation and assembly module TamB